jgi:hypothetical protein
MFCRYAATGRLAGATAKGHANGKGPSPEPVSCHWSTKMCLLLERACSHMHKGFCAHIRASTKLALGGDAASVTHHTAAH